FLIPFLISMICTHLISTLFPYTTLFRSDGLDVRRIRDNFKGCPRTKDFIGTGFDDSHHDVVFRVVISWYAHNTSALEHEGDGTRDRKSTRLNSSHVSISYAVFCLKQKHI